MTYTPALYTTKEPNSHGIHWLFCKVNLEHARRIGSFKDKLDSARGTEWPCIHLGDRGEYGNDYKLTNHLYYPKRDEEGIVIPQLMLFPEDKIIAVGEESFEAHCFPLVTKFNFDVRWVKYSMQLFHYFQYLEGKITSDMIPPEMSINAEKDREFRDLLLSVFGPTLA